MVRSNFHINVERVSKFILDSFKNEVSVTSKILFKIVSYMNDWRMLNLYTFILTGTALTNQIVSESLSFSMNWIGKSHWNMITKKRFSNLKSKIKISTISNSSKVLSLKGHKMLNLAKLCWTTLDLAKMIWDSCK